VTLKLLMVNYEFPPIGGGAGKAHLALLKQYAATDQLQVDVLTSGLNPGFEKEQLADNVTIYKVGLHKKNLHYWRKTEVIEWLIKAPRYYKKMITENSYDLAHAFFAFPSGWLCYKSADKLPLIISLRGSDVPGYNVRLGLDYKILSGLFRKIWHSAAAIVANSAGLKKLANQFTPELDIEVIPNGIDTKIYHPSADKKPHKSLKLLTVCRLISRKRIDLLIKAVAELKKAGIKTELNIAGDGNLLNQLKALASQLNIKDSVNFLGRIEQEDMPGVYRDNDVFVMSSTHEGMSNAMLEAIASGLPIVTTRCEGVEELLKDNGVIVEQPTEIANAIAALANDHHSYAVMAEASKKVAETFSWQAAANQYIECYKKIINRR